MKKLFAIALSLIMILGAVSVFTSCNPAGKELVALDATDLLKEDFGIAVKKGNTELLDKINKALDDLKADGTIDSIINKYIPKDGGAQ